MLRRPLGLRQHGVQGVPLHPHGGILVKRLLNKKCLASSEGIRSLITETVLCHDNQQVTGPVSWDCWYRLADTMLFSWAVVCGLLQSGQRGKYFCTHSIWNCQKCCLSHCFKINVPFYCMQINSFVRFYRKPYFKPGKAGYLHLGLRKLTIN